MTNGNGKDCWFVSSFPVPEGYFLRESLGQRVALPLRGKKEQLQARAAPRPIPGKRRASPGRNAAGNGTGNSPVSPVHPDRKQCYYSTLSNNNNEAGAKPPVLCSRMSSNKELSIRLAASTIPAHVQRAD